MDQLRQGEMGGTGHPPSGNRKNAAVKKVQALEKLTNIEVRFHLEARRAGNRHLRM